MRLFAFIAVLIALLPSSAIAKDIDLVFRHGVPIKDREAVRAGRIRFASWIDDELIVYLAGGDVTCISTEGGDVQWTVRDFGMITDWSVSLETKRLAVLTLDGTTSVIDCNNGELIFTADRIRMATILGLTSASPTRVAMAPNDGRMIVCTFSTFYGRNAYVLDPSFTKVLSSFDIDAAPAKLLFSLNGQRAAIIADDGVLCVRDLRENRDVFFRGTRIKEKPTSRTFTIDVPFFSHLRDSGADELVYTLDNSWATGEVFVHNLTTGNTTSFDGRNGHIELAVSFPTRRVALTGTSTDLTVLDFDGIIVAHKKGATMQRSSAVEFSPSSRRILVASWDGTISVFFISDDGK